MPTNAQNTDGGPVLSPAIHMRKCTYQRNITGFSGLHPNTNQKPEPYHHGYYMSDTIPFFEE